jgi:hypothetical protein
MHLEYKGRLALCFLAVQNIKNMDVYRKWYAGYERYFSIYCHLSGPRYPESTDGPAGDYKWDPELWLNRVDAHGIPHVPTKWGTMSLVKAESLIYKAGLKDPENKIFVLLSESDVPLWSFPEIYSLLMGQKRSYLTYESTRFIDHDMYLKCFPKKFVPSTKPVSSRTRLNTTTYTAHQWKILNRRDAAEFVKMADNHKYMSAYENCFKHDPNRLAPDEYSFSNWISLKYGPRELRKRFRNLQTTFVSFDETAEHALEYDDISADMLNEFCLDQRYETKDGRGSSMFARKFKNSPILLDKIPIKCPKKLVGH